MIQVIDSYNAKETEVTTTIRQNMHNVGTLLKIGTIGKGGQGQRVYDPAGSACQITSQGGGWGAKTGLYAIGGAVRRLTPLECERLQGFPDGWTESLSDTQKYKVLGNAVTVAVVKAIAERLAADFKRKRPRDALDRIA